MYAYLLLSSGNSVYETRISGQYDGWSSFHVLFHNLYSIWISNNRSEFGRTNYDQLNSDCVRLVCILWVNFYNTGVTAQSIPSDQTIPGYKTG